jgi:hypothetical protein
MPYSSAVPPERSELLELAHSITGVAPPAAIVVEPAAEREWLLAALTEVIARWLRTDRSRLGQALYRIDVSERLVEAAVAADPIAEAPRRIAELAVARMEAKIANRARLEALLRSNSGD